MLTKKLIVETLKGVVNTRLEKRVLNILLREYSNYEGTPAEKFDYIFSDYSKGCSTGVVKDLIYYKDTRKWFNLYRNEIIAMLESVISEGLFEIKYMENEIEYFPVVTFDCYNGYVRLVEYSNKIYTKIFDDDLKNTLAWYSFERVISDLMNVYEGLRYN